MADWSNDINQEEAIKAKRIVEEELESKKLDQSRITELKASIERAKAAIETSSIRD